ncbi:MAG: hypothetical protein U0271_06415 [Polyangiaceae bacterium]
MMRSLLFVTSLAAASFPLVALADAAPGPKCKCAMVGESEGAASKTVGVAGALTALAVGAVVVRRQRREAERRSHE